MLFQSQLARAVRAAAGACTLVALAALASCGGGTYQVRTYLPQRLLSFGDESSLLLPDGSKYSINGVNATTHLQDCTVNPLWFQSLAATYGMVYPECNPEAAASPAAHSYATVGATVDDIANALNAFSGSDSFTPNDLVTIYIGTHDVLAVYAESASADETAALAEMRSRALIVANQVNAIVGTGAKVLLLTIPDMGASPFAVLENERGDFDRALLLSHMTQEFNRTMRSNIINDGSKIGLVLVDDYIAGAVRSPLSFGLLTTTIAACLDTAPLPSCTTDTVNTEVNGNAAVPTQFLWADATHLGSAANSTIGAQAVSRVRTNPF